VANTGDAQSFRMVATIGINFSEAPIMQWKTWLMFLPFKHDRSNAAVPVSIPGPRETGL
jgi:hypothetical protein